MCDLRCLLLGMAMWLICLYQVAYGGAIVGNALINPTDNDGMRLSTNRLVLVVLDTLGDGFLAGSDHGIDEGPLGTSLGPDDLIIGRNATVTGFFPGDVVGHGDATFVDGQHTGRPFALVFFDTVPANQDTITATARYGLVRHPDWVLPASGSSTFGASGFTAVQGAATTFSVKAGSTDLMSYTKWAMAMFGNATETNTLPSANADQDDYTNLFEYTFGLNPHGADNAGIPNITMESDGNDADLIMTYTRPTNRTGIELTAEVSRDMKRWVSGDSEIQELSNELTGEMEHRQYRTISGDAARLFMRLRITQVP